MTDFPEMTIATDAVDAEMDELPFLSPDPRPDPDPIYLYGGSGEKGILPANESLTLHHGKWNLSGK